MKAMGYDRNHTQVKNKLKSLKQKYKSVVFSNNKSGSGRVEWEHFDAMDRMLGTRPARNLPRDLIIESDDANQPGTSGLGGGSSTSHDSKKDYIIGSCMYITLKI